jgi:hypothetical protein
MQTRGVLNNGDTLNYALGIVVDEYKSHKRLQHGGSIGGYRSMVQTYPDQELNLVLLTNFSSSNIGSRINRMADLMLGLDSASPSGELYTASSVNSIQLPASEMEKYSGLYWSAEANHSRKIYLKEDTLRYFRSESSESKLIPVGVDAFQMIDVPSIVLVSFNLENDQSKTMEVRVGDNKPGLLKEYTPPEINADVLHTYAGTYLSPELDTYYTFFVQGDTMLMGNHTRHGDFEINILREDILEASYPLGNIQVSQDRKGRINGLHVSNGRVKNLWLEKQ